MGISQTSDNAVNTQSLLTMHCYMLATIPGGIVPTVPFCQKLAFLLFKTGSDGSTLPAHYTVCSRQWYVISECQMQHIAPPPVQR